MVLMLLGVVACAQTTPELEVASVRRAAPETGPDRTSSLRGGPGTSDPGRVTFSNVTLKQVLLRTQKLRAFQLSVPAWFDTEHYDIAAKVSAGTTDDQFAIMIQNLLVQRFGLKLHHETREFSAYDLVVAKGGPKLQQSDRSVAQAPRRPGNTAADADGFPVLRAGSRDLISSTIEGHVRLSASHQPIASLVNMLNNQLGRPVRDKTGLTGTYDFKLDYSMEGLVSRKQRGGLPALSSPDSGDGAPSIFTALQQRLGLKLVQTRSPFDVLVVDHAEKLPTEN